MINFAHGDIFMMALFAYFGIATFNLPWPFAFWGCPRHSTSGDAR
jgi:branched-chain amino acid transport system permease protein